MGDQILPAEKVNTKKSFESNYADFQRILQDLTDLHERGDSTVLSMNVNFATAYAETLQDQGELSMMLATLFELNAEMDGQIAAYQEFFGSSSGSN